MTTTNHTIQHDVIIVGGGLSGMLSALSLVSATKANGKPLSVALVEAKPLVQHPKTSFDDRVLALSHHSATYLKQLGVWSAIADKVTPITQIHISDRNHLGKARLYAQDHGVEALGYVIELAKLGQALYERLKHFAEVHWYCPNAVDAIHWQAEQVVVQLQQGQSLIAKLLLACDGAHSRCRQLAKINSYVKPYQQSAIIANVKLQQPHQGQAFERFTPCGPLALLPMSDNRCSLVWTQPDTDAEAIANLSDTEFKQALQQAFGYWLGTIVQVGQREVHPLSLVTVERNSFHRMALVGNASHTMHPIAGQGFNLGLRDVVELSELITRAWQQQQDIGALRLLQCYEQRRLPDQQRMISVTDSLVHCFSNDYAPLVVSRNIGLTALNYLSPLKHVLAKTMMGY